MTDRPLKVVHLVNRYLPPTQRWIHPQTAAVPGVEGTVVARTVMEGALERFPHPKVESLKANHPLRYRLALGARPVSLKAVGNLARGVLGRRRFDLAHAHFGHVGWRYLDAVQSAGLPLAVTFYGYDMSRLAAKPVWKKRYRDLFQYLSVVLCEGPHMAERIRGLGCPFEKIRVHELGADLDRLSPSVRKLRPGEPLKVLAAARFTEKKGLVDAVRAVARAARKADVTLTILGDDPKSRASRTEKARIVKAVRETGLNGSARILPAVPFDELVSVAAEHHLLLSPSKTASDGDCEGGAPVTLIEMMATGMPVVATRHCDIPHLVSDTGLLAPEGDVRGLAAHLLKFVQNPGLLCRMGEAAADRRGRCSI